MDSRTKGKIVSTQQTKKKRIRPKEKWFGRSRAEDNTIKNNPKRTDSAQTYPKRAETLNVEGEGVELVDLSPRKISRGTAQSHTLIGYGRRRWSKPMNKDHQILSFPFNLYDLSIRISITYTTLMTKFLFACK